MAGALRLAYFAWVRERIGLDGEERTRPMSGTTIDDLLDQLSTEGARYGRGVRRSLQNTRCARSTLHASRCAYRRCAGTCALSAGDGWLKNTPRHPK